MKHVEFCRGMCGVIFFFQKQVGMIAYLPQFGERRNMKHSIFLRKCVSASRSPCFMIGVWNRSENSVYVPRNPGIRKSKIDQISDTLFSSGVPVSARRQRASTSFIICAFWVA